MFGIENDDNFGLINKVSKIFNKGGKSTNRTLSSQFEGEQSILKDEVSIMKKSGKFKLDLKMFNDAAFPNNLSKIEITNVGNDNILSTERYSTISEKKRQLLVGKKSSILVLDYLLINYCFFFVNF